MSEINEVMQSVAELRKVIDTRLDDCVTRNQVEKMTEDIVAKLVPATPKAIMPVDTEEGIMQRATAFKFSPKNVPEKAFTSEYGKKFVDMRGFLNAVKSRVPMDVKATMVEGTPGLGGYLVPTDFYAEVVKLLNEESPIFRMARVLPMNTWKRLIPTQLTNVSIGWVGEATVKAKTNITTGQVAQEAKVMAAIIKCTDELLRDSAINLTAFLSELIAEAIALETERVALVGDVSGASDPFNGILHASGVNVVTMAGSNVSGDDIIDLVMSLNGANAANAKIALSRAGLKKVLKLKNEKGDYIYSAPNGSIPGMIYGVPYEICSQIPSTLGTGAQDAMIFGRFDRGLMLSPRTQLELKVSQDAADWVSEALESAFTQDQTWLRFTQAMSIDVLQGSAFSYILI